jgi:hypothetical protein
MRPRRPDVEGLKAVVWETDSSVPTLDALRLQELDGAPSWREIIPGGPAFPLLESYDTLCRFATSSLARMVALRLHRRACDRPERAKDAAMSGLGAQHGFTSFALVKKLACVGGHPLPLDEAALRTGQNRIGFDSTHLRLRPLGIRVIADNTSASARPEPQDADDPLA